MKRTSLWLLAMLAGPVPAAAAPSEIRATLEYADFTGDFGERQVARLEYDFDFGDTSVMLSGVYGRRDYQNSSYSAPQGSVTVYHDWSDRIYTRTSASVSTDDPVFPTLDAAQDFNFKITPNVVLLAGGRYTRYFGGREALSGSAGITYYFRGGFVSYRYTVHDVQGLGTTDSHLASVRLNDSRGRGFTQLWLGAGSAVQEVDALPDLFRGNYLSVAARRVQPLSGSVALDLSLSHAWHDTGLADYEGTTIRLGLGFRH